LVEKRLLKGDFATSPLRLLKIADLMPANQLDTARRVLYAVNLKKKQVIKDGQELQPKGIAARKECILHGQYRAFVADAVLHSLDPHTDPKNTPASDLRPADLCQTARQSNTYNQSRLRRELDVLDGRGMLNPAWKQSLDQLLTGELGKKLAKGDAFLIRLGRYGGAENKTLSGEGVAQIKIMQGKGQPPVIQDTTKTVWLAAEYESEQKHLLPFGWAVVEIDPQDGDLPQLKAWCDAQSKGRPDMAKLRQQFEADKQAALQQKTEQAALAAQRLAAKMAEELEAQQRVARLATLSEQGQQIEALRQKCEDWATKMPPHGNFKHQEANIGKAGLFQDASKLVTQALSGPQWRAIDKAGLADMLEQCLPKVVAPWGKDERKKLKIAALRGQ
jgi:CRISPR-associated protein Csm5